MRTETADLTLEGLVHDLNNVFQTIGESAELLDGDPKWAKLARTLQRNVHRGQRIVRSILETNRPDGELAPIVEGSIQFSKDYLECVHGPRLDFSQHIDPEFRVRGDAASWERVLVNLFVNAAEAGAQHVIIDASGGEIVISDNGPGIPKELLPRIFQAHVSTKSILSGLGLYVVQSIVEQNGGSVIAENGSSGGAVFRIRT
jgi:signal transduction histidine kinase